MITWKVVSVCCFILVLGMICGFGLGQLCRNTIPLIDWGHRCFAIPDEQTAKVLLPLLERFGLKESFTFSPGKTHQTVMNDGTTVLIWFDKDVAPELQKNGISLVTDDPQEDCDWFAIGLREKGYTCKIRDDIFPPEMREKIVILETDAFLDSVVVFRLRSLDPFSPDDMGERPNLRKITPK